MFNLSNSDFEGFVRIHALIGTNIRKVFDLINLIPLNNQNRTHKNEELEKLYLEVRKIFSVNIEDEIVAGPSSYFEGDRETKAELEGAYLDILRNYVKDKEHILLKSICEDLDINEPLARYLLEKIQYVEKNFKIVPRFLTDLKKAERKQKCFLFLGKFTWDPLFVRSIVSIDEFFLRGYYPIVEDKAFRPLDSSPPKKRGILRNDWKRLFIIACYQGQIITYMMVPEGTVNGEVFCNFLKSKVYPEVKKRNIKKVQLMYDDAGAHRWLPIMEWIEKTGWDKFEHPSLSPDMFPPDYSIIKRIDEEMPKGVLMTPNEAIAAFITTYKKINKETVWNEEELPNRWREIIGRNGNYLDDAVHPW